MRRIICALAIITSFGFSTAVAHADDICFVLREEHEKLALYREDIAEPLMVFDPPISGLPAADAELLREGVRFKSQAEVMRLLEDLEVRDKR